MFLKLLQLEWKSLFRSSQFLMGILMKIGMFIGAAYFAFIFIGGAFGLYYGSQEGGENPLAIFSRYFVGFWVVDLLVKYFMQQLPTNNIKPLLTQNISKNKIVTYILFKVSLSFLTWGYLLFIIPFSILLAIDSSFSVLGILALAFSTLFLVLNNALVNIIINKNNVVLYLIFAVIAMVAALQYYQIIDVFIFFENVFLSIYHHAYWAIIPIVLFCLVGKFTFGYIKKNLYLDKGLELKKNIGKTEDVLFLKKYGKIGVFINNDIRMIKRSKMARSAALGSVFFLLYGLLFLMGGSTYKSSFMQLFSGLFVTGGFMFTFGQRVPAWDSSYYPLMMTQNIPYKEYIKAKWYMSVFTIAIAIVLALGYAWISWEFYFTIFAAGLYNLGVNSYLTLLAGAYNKKPIDLNSDRKAFAGGQNNFSLKTFLFMVPQMILPMLVFAVAKYFFGITVAVIILGILGLIGFLLKDKIFSQIVKAYKTEKYTTISAFKQD
jgi:hypothetical protein